MSSLPLDGASTLPPRPVPPTYEIPTSILSLPPELTQIPHVQNLLADLRTARLESSQAKSELFRTQLDIFAWRLKLHARLEALEKENQRLKDELETRQLAVLASNDMYKHHFTTGESMSRDQAHADTFTPPRASVRSSIRPKHIPFEVLWNLEDCCKDSHAVLQNANPSRPPMQFVLRKKDGSLISVERYATILEDTMAVVSTCPHLYPHPNEVPSLYDRKIPDIDCGGLILLCPSGFEWIYYRAMNDAIRQLEAIHEELTDCCGHWKAEHMLMAALDLLKPPVTEAHADPPRSAAPPTISNTGPGTLHPPQPMRAAPQVIDNTPPAISLHQLQPDEPKEVESPNTILKRPRSYSTDTATVAATKKPRTMRTENSASKERERSATAQLTAAVAGSLAQPVTASAPAAVLVGCPLTSSLTTTSNPRLLHEALQALFVAELKQWVHVHAIPLRNRDPRKSDLIDAILSSTHIPSDADFQAIHNERREKRPRWARFELEYGQADAADAY